MEVTVNRKAWLRHSGDIQECAPRIEELKENYLHDYSKSLATWWRGSIYDIFSEESLELSHSCIAGHLINAESVTVYYYRFGDLDDKHFLCNSLGQCFEDSRLYSDFYNTLPKPSRLLHLTSSHAASLWIPPRAQYGHFLMDILLPSLACYKEKFGLDRIQIELLQSRDWQCNACYSFAKLMGFREVSISFHEIREETPVSIVLKHGYLAVPCFPYVLEAIRYSLAGLVSKRTKYHYGKESISVFMSRQGFGSERLINIKEITEYLVNSNVLMLQPHKMHTTELASIISRASTIISEPGTTPLIGYLLAGKRTRFITLCSKRALTQCNAMYAYSGWKYHLPWHKKIEVLWGRPKLPHDNPFSDVCYYPLSYLKNLLEIYSAAAISKA